MNGLKLYLHSMGILARAQAQYRVSALFQSIAMLVMSGSEFVAIQVLLARFQRFAAWSGDEIIFFFGLMMFVFCIVEMFGRGITTFSTQVQQGEFDRILLRPRSKLLQILCSRIDIRRFIVILLGLFVMVAAKSRLQLLWGLAQYSTLLVSILGGISLFLGLFLIEAVVSLRSIQSLEIVNVLTYGGRQAGQYPADVYDKKWRWLLYVVPYALTMHIPAAWLLGKPMDGVTWPWVLLTPLFGVVFLICMIWAFDRAAWRYQSTGS